MLRVSAHTTPIIYAILCSDATKPSPKWKMIWKGSEERLKPEIMAEIRPYKEQLKLCFTQGRSRYIKNNVLSS